MFKRFPVLAKTFAKISNPFVLAVQWWMDEIHTWLDVVYAADDERATRNHNPWDDGGGFDGSGAFMGGEGA